MPKHRRPGRPRADESGPPTDAVIVQTASRLFLDRGYQKVSIDEVAEACGVTKATVYYYFDNKAQLFTKSMLAMMQRIRERIAAMLSVDKPLRTRLHEVAVAHLQATMQIDLDGFMRETKNALSPSQVKLMREAEERMYQAIEEAFDKSIKAGEIPEINATFAAHAYISLLKIGNYRLADNTRLFPNVETAADHIIAFLWNGLFCDQ
ncbi:MAG TPA: TetR/AcrR family transcriptional regulator [Bacillales bacterium]|nr:TetR/AcrR family transcriptional regulator [Bacillales bacterium]